jgi:hypothetical protein
LELDRVRPSSSEQVGRGAFLRGLPGHRRLQDVDTTLEEATTVMWRDRSFRHFFVALEKGLRQSDQLTAEEVESR